MTQFPPGLIQAFNTMALQEPDPNWYMDFGASNHIASTTGNLQSTFNTGTMPLVTVGNRSLASVKTIGHGTFSSPSRSFSLRNVLVCPAIIKNLISVRKFVTDNWCTIEFDPFGFSVKDLHTRNKLLRCDSSGPLYSVTSSSPTSSPHVLATSSLDGSVWHRRFGHPSSSVLAKLLSFLSFSLPKSDLTSLCQACQLGKHIRLPFSNSNTIVYEPFEIVHSDIWTSPVSSISGLKYYLIFLDQFSHFVWVYPLHRKSDTFEKYVHFSNYVQTQFNRRIKSLQCDNGGEYDNRGLKDHLASQGTLLRFSCPHTSQQNRRAERMLRTINNMIRTLLFQASLPPEYWVEALYTSNHLLNLLPSTAINNDVPYAKLFNKTPTYHHLCTFGCLCYPNLLPTSSHKLA